MPVQASRYDDLARRPKDTSMKSMVNSFAAIVGLSGLLGILPPAHAAGINWASVPGKDIVLF